MKDESTHIRNKIREINSVADQFPGIVIIHNINNQFGKVEYMSRLGLSKLGITLEQVRNMQAADYKKFFNEEDANDYYPKMYELVQRNNMDEIFSFFQQVRRSPEHPWEWYISTTRILMRDPENKPLLSITFAVPIDPLHHVTTKVSRLLDENNFLRTNFPLFSKLGQRERDVLAGIASGRSVNEIAENLSISADTVKTHRKNIKRKLEAKSTAELIRYARAFDLAE